MLNAVINFALKQLAMTLIAASVRVNQQNAQR
jgi:hypothetical protein